MNQTDRRDHLRGVGDERVFLSAEWRHLAMLNYEVDARLLLPFVPSGTEIDRWQGKVCVSLVGFRFLKTKVFGFVSIPLHANFDEVNLRFYVRRQEGDEVRRGVVFIREIVPRHAIAFVARTLYHENYVCMPMAHEIRPIVEDNWKIEYRWRCEGRWAGIGLETEGNAALPDEGSREQFITEHYWGYAAQPDGGCVEYRVEHPSWKVWQVRHSAFEGDAEKLYGKELAAALRGRPDSAFLAEGSAVSVMRGRKL
jgi:uncharacterized protein